MFSKELENLIQATLEDGVLEDYEKAALVKRAQAEGVDLTELEIYINSILQKRKRELDNKKQAQRVETEQKKREEFGEKCPNCGQQRKPMAIKCDCGYEFVTKKVVSSVQTLFDKIEEISKKKYKTKTEQEERNKKIRDAITMFPVPNTKEDIIEFLALSIPKSKKKGGIMGSVNNRFAVFVVALVVIIILTGIFLPDTYESTVHEGFFTTKQHTEVKEMPKFVILLLLSFFGGIGCFWLANNLDQETLLWNREADIWRAKSDQVLMKGRSLLGDSEFQRQLDYYENMAKGS